MSTQQNLFVLYPPGVGGNHFANMLSLGKNFAKRFSDNSYDNPVKHNTFLAHHFSSVPQFDVDIISKNLKVLTQQNNVFAGHWLAYHVFNKSGLAKHFANKKFFCIQFPGQNTKAFARLKRMGLVSNNYLTTEITTLYKCDCLSLLCQEPESNFYYVWPHLLFDDDFSVTIKDLQKQGFEIDLDLDLAQTFHDQWLDNLEKENLK
jgi:hypothetical protein